MDRTSTTVAELRALAAAAAGVRDDGEMKMRVGFPPRELQAGTDEERARSIGDCGICDGEIITVSGTTCAGAAAAEACPVAPRRSPRLGPTMVRRVMKDDNSCLFSAIGYLMMRQRSAEAELRCLVADAIAADNGPAGEGRFNAGILGQVRLPCRSRRAVFPCRDVFDSAPVIFRAETDPSRMRFAFVHGMHYQSGCCIVLHMDQDAGCVGRSDRTHDPCEALWRPHQCLRHPYSTKGLLRRC